MAEETGEQLKFPEVEDPQESASAQNNFVQEESEQPRKSMPIPEGTIYRTGPFGDRYTQFRGYAPEGSWVIVKNSRVVEGHRSMNVEFESPPEMQGKSGWITPMKGGKHYK